MWYELITNQDIIVFTCIKSRGEGWGLEDTPGEGEGKRKVGSREIAVPGARTQIGDRQTVTLLVAQGHSYSVQASGRLALAWAMCASARTATGHPR